MRRFFVLRAVLFVLLILWATAYLPVYFLSGAIPAPLSACQILFLPVFGLGAGYYVIIALFALCLAGMVMSLWRRFAEKWWVLFPPVLLAALDILGQVFCIRATPKEDMTAYYYFNGVAPVPHVNFYVAIAADAVLLILLLLPAFLPRFRQKDTAPEEKPEGFLTTDNWEEVLGEAASMHEDDNPEGRKN